MQSSFNSLSTVNPLLSLSWGLFISSTFKEEGGGGGGGGGGVLIK